MPLSPPTDLPLVFLDVDGVVNDLGSAIGVERPWPEERLELGPAAVCIPVFVPPLLQYLEVVAEIQWLTTWGDMANQLLADLLEIGPCPVAGEPDPLDTEWKVRVARPIAVEAIEAGRKVYWIEDFAGELPEGMPGSVTFVDTAARGEFVLLPHHLPPELLPEGLRDP